MVVSEHDITNLRQAQNETIDVTTPSIEATRQLLGALQNVDRIPQGTAALIVAVEGVSEALRLPLTRTVDDYTQTAFSQSVDLEQVRILGLTARQHSHAVVLGSLCESFAAFTRAQHALRDAGEGGIQELSPVFAEAQKSMLSLLQGAARAYSNSLIFP